MLGSTSLVTQIKNTNELETLSGDEMSPGLASSHTSHSTAPREPSPVFPSSHQTGASPVFPSSFQVGASPMSFRFISPRMYPTNRPPSYQSPNPWSTRGTPRVRFTSQMGHSGAQVVGESLPANMAGFSLPPAFEPFVTGAQKIYKRVLRMLQLRPPFLV